MKNEFSIDEIKNSLKKMQKKDNDNTVIAIVAAVGIVVLVVTVIVAIVKLTDRLHDEEDLFDEGFSDEEGIYLADEDDFE